MLLCLFDMLEHLQDCNNLSNPVNADSQRKVPSEDLHRSLLEDECFLQGDWDESSTSIKKISILGCRHKSFDISLE